MGCHTLSTPGPAPPCLWTAILETCPPGEGMFCWDRAAFADVTRLALMGEAGGGMRGRGGDVGHLGWPRVVGLVPMCSGCHRVRCGPVTDLVTLRPVVALTKRHGARVRMAGRFYGPQTPVYTLL
jgi:hypothetical protein